MDSITACTRSDAASSTFLESSERPPAERGRRSGWLHTEGKEEWEGKEKKGADNEGEVSEVEEREERSGDEGQSTMWSDWWEAG